MTSTDLVPSSGRERVLRAPIGLLVATGALVPTKDGKSERPTQLGYFRFKEGALEQYADAAATANDVYGDEPTSLDDVYLLSNTVGDILDIRIKAWSKSGLRIIGQTNFAELPPDEYAQRVDAWDDDIEYRPRELKDVPTRLRATWNGESIFSKLAGPNDPRIGKFEMRVEATFRFCLPKVFGMGPVALYTTTSKHNRDQLYKGITDASQWLQGNLIGIPFRFRIRPRKTSYFDREKRAYLPTQTFEVVFDTPWTMQEAIDAIREQREALGAGTHVERLALPAADTAFFNGTDARTRDEQEEAIISASRSLPQPTDEDVRTREEPSAIQRLDDAQLNRLANLAGMFDGDLSIYLRGAFAVDALDELTPDQAVQAELALERLTGEERVEEGEYEEVDLNGIDF
jgi:hypothetical protein